MRYADGPTAHAEVLIDAPIERVWALVSDIEVPARFSEELVAVRWVDDERGVGARFVGTNQHESVGEWEMTNHVVRCEPNRVFEWAVHDPAQPASSWWFELESEGEQVRLRQSGRLGPGENFLSMVIASMPEKEERIIARRLREHEANMALTLEGIKRLAEEADPAATGA